MHRFTTLPNSFAQVRNQLLLRYIPIVALLLGFVWFLDTDPHHTSLWQVLPLMAVALGIGIFMGIRRQKKQFESYTLRFQNQQIIRESDGLPVLTIPYEEVRGILKTDKNTYSILSSSKLDAIGIPSQITEPVLLESLLNEIHPIEYKKSYPWQTWSGIIGMVLGLGLLAIILSAENKWLIGISGGVFVALNVAGFWIIQVSKNVDHRTKQLSYLFVLSLLSFGSIAVLKLLK